jgi:N-acetylneuraminic acid mutarotase
VLVAGGIFEQGAEVWDPKKQRWEDAKELPRPCWSHGEALLPDGKVVLFGGFAHYDAKKQLPQDGALVFNPRSAGWAAGPKLPTPMGNETVTVMKNEQVLLAGGRDVTEAGTPRFSRLSFLFNPKNGKYKALGKMRFARSLHTATMLADGRVLVTGGENAKGVLNTAEIMDPRTGRWRKIAPMQERRRSHTATLLLDGRVLVVGGENQRGSLHSVEIFDPDKKSWQEAIPMRKPRACHTATLLPDGAVLIAGGRRSPAKESATRDVVLWQPPRAA